jgi:bacterioferritin
MQVKGGKEIVDLLNEVLTGELTAVNQYFLHAKMFENWGIDLLAKAVRAESIDEMKHADQLIDRILYLDGIPNVQRLGRVRIGETPREMLDCDMQLELEAIPRLNAGIAVCREHGDNGTRALLEAILVSEEGHLDWLEAQVSMIDRIGEAAYVAEHLR